MGLMTYMIPVGFAISCSTLLGQYIGKGKANFVDHYYRLLMKIAVLVALFQNVVLFVFENQIIGLFTTHDDIKQTIRTAWIIFNLFVIVDTIQGIAASSIRAAGQ